MISRTGNSGFSLIEVLVASVILFAGLGAVLKAYSMAVEALGAASETLWASELLSEKAAGVDLQAMASRDSVQDQSGRETKAGVDYVWDIQSLRQDLTPRLAFQKTSLRVVRSRGGLPHTLEIEKALFRDPP